MAVSMKHINKNSPIIIGGVGGSGTRLVAEILVQFGVYLGNTLTESLDNLWFTALFKRRDLFEKEPEERKAEIKKGLDILTEAVVGGCAFPDDLRNRVMEYTRDIPKDAYSHEDVCFNKEFEHYLNNRQDFIENIVCSKKPEDDFAGWGWKEPNTHIILEELAQYYSNMRYIHVLRHGLDMAYGTNQIQVKFWGPMYGVTPLDKNYDPVASFRYWVKANQKALDTGEKMLPGRFLIIQYERLCNDPEKEIKRLITFVQLSLSNEALNTVTKIPSPPSSIGRYKTHDTSWITVDDIQSLHTFGYTY